MLERKSFMGAKAPRREEWIGILLIALGKDIMLVFLPKNSLSSIYSLKLLCILFVFCFCFFLFPLGQGAKIQCTIAAKLFMYLTLLLNVVMIYQKGL